MNESMHQIGEGNVIEILKDASNKILEAGKILAYTRQQLDTAKHQEKVVRAKATIKYCDAAKNQKVLEAMVEADEEVIAQSTATIRAQTNHEIAKIDHDYEDNLFISARKLGGMDERELKMISGSTITRKPNA